MKTDTQILRAASAKVKNYVKQKYIGYNLCEAKRKFLELINSL